jgi:hypothetical protein
MRRFCYVIINNAGHSWPIVASVNGEAPREMSAPILPQLLEEGWVPVRETPMGGGSSQLAHSLILLEKEAQAKIGRPSRKAK